MSLVEKNDLNFVVKSSTNEVSNTQFVYQYIINIDTSDWSPRTRP